MQFGNDFTLTPESKLEFIPGIKHPAPDVRQLSDALAVLAEPTPEEDRPLYYMYRGVCLDEHQQLYADHHIRYDLTVVLPGAIGNEYIKTVGHFHPLKPHSPETYPEYYEVLHGEAIYLLQRNGRNQEVEEVLAIKARPGDKVFIPSGFGHVTVNPGPQPLVMANLIESNFSSLYESFARNHGAAYYYIKCSNNKGDFIPNPNYLTNSTLKIIAAPSLRQPLDLDKEHGLYETFIANPGVFSILI